MFVKKNAYSRMKLTVCIVISTLLFCTPYSNAGIGLFELNSPYWYIRLDASAYADISYWYPSIRHNCGTAHEMLTGEWAAAIYYDGIATGEQAMWLTDEFQVPTWTTTSDFSTVSYNTWNDENNPIWEVPPDPPYWPYDPPAPDKHDTGQSIIENDEVRVTIDYEMVDLGDQGENGEGGSPMAFGSLVGADALVYSERYVLLQTYTITNTTDSPIEDLEFYQMLHGHPADEGNAVVYSVYDDTAHDDPLEEYTPYNEVHAEEGSTYAGNFRYDITQWTTPMIRISSHRWTIGTGSDLAPP